MSHKGTKARPEAPSKEPSAEVNDPRLPRFCVVVPLYNKAPHVAQALRSALEQTYPPTEILVIDDKSSDGGDRIVLDLDDSRIRLLRRDRPGPGGYAARNLGIREAGSEWIAFLDADDEWLPDHLHNLARAIREQGPQSDVCTAFAGYRIVFPNGMERLDRYSAKVEQRRLTCFSLEQIIDIWISMDRCPIWTSATACRRDALIRAGLFPEDRCRRGGDKDMWLRMLSVGGAVSATGISAVYYRDAVNMVTRENIPNAAPCIVATLRQMVGQSTGRTRTLLKRLANREMFLYATYAANAATVNRKSWQGFYWRSNLFQFAVLNVLSTSWGAYLFRKLNALRLSRKNSAS